MLTWPVFSPPIWATCIILGYVTVQRLGELLIARRNTRSLMARGGLEIGRSHYGPVVALHAVWLISLWVFAFGRPIDLTPLVIFALVQIVRFWTLVSIGRRWTTRVIVVPGETLVRKGPYRFVSHPNYMVVVAEILLLPCVFRLYAVAALFTILNALVLAIRIPIEMRALNEHATRLGQDHEAERRSI